MKISIDKGSSVPVYLQIRNQIKDQVLSGLLPPGFRLPPERKLAEMLGINRSTVLNAYRELKADALIDSHIGQGTVVLSPKPPEPFSFSSPAALPWHQLFSGYVASIKEPLLRDLMEIVGRENVISFAAGMAAPELFPLEIFQKIYRRVTQSYGPAAFLHTPTEGCYFFRESISTFMGARGVSLSPEEILILSGSQQGLDLLVRAFLDPGDAVIVEEPSFFSAIQAFQAAGARVREIPVDQNGMQVELLEPMLIKYKPKFIYTLPTFQNPSGAVMSLQRRGRLLELAYKYQVPVLEDDPYGELRYEDQGLPSLKALDTRGYVIYLSTFSKMLFPGLRVGWLAAPPPVVHKLALIKQMVDLHPNSLAQYLIDAFLKEGLLDRHLDQVRREYALRRNVMLEELTRWAPPETYWNEPKGGYYLWCRLPENTVLSKLLTKCADRGVAFVPGDVFFTGSPPGNYIRLNFTFSKPEKIRAGVKQFISALNETLQENKTKRKGIKNQMKPIV